MISMNKKYKTRDGREVRLYSTEGGDVYPIHGAVKFPEGGWKAVTWTVEGMEYQYALDQLDLVEVKPRIKRTMWLNVYDNSAYSHHSKERADTGAGDHRIACISIDIDVEEGEGL